jgi:outer membrane protein assembly factor BamB
MRAETTLTSPGTPAEQPPSGSAKRPRLWPAVALVALFWALHFVVGGLEKPYFYGFLYSMAAAALLALLFFTWWWTNRRVRLGERLYAFALVVGTGAVVGPLCDKSIWFALPTVGLPLALTAWTLWMLLVRATGFRWNWLGLLAVVVLTWGYFPLVRMDGVNADLQADMRWRWSPSAEDLFLAERAARASERAPDSQPAPAGESLPTLTPGDWTGFRGPDRDGVIRGVTTATDWNTAPPRPVWRQRVGPAWSSVIVVGDRLFTQEQRGEREAVVCYQASTGQELWAHEDPARFWEAVSGAGPRATPSFADGRVYTLGAKGLLNCLDAVTGRRHWSRDVTADSGAKVPMWGFAGSPLVVGGLVIVFAGGEGDKNLLAYHTGSGELAWTAPAGQDSYSSPQPATVGGKRQCLFLSDTGLTAVDPASGAVLWKHGLAMPGAPRAVQPHVIGETQLVVGTLAGPGVARIDVTPDGNGWKTTDLWATTKMKPEFPDFVVHEGHVYGFDAGTFCCLDAATGDRCWREGRYGRGQVMLLADQALLLVLSESGEAVLLAANPRRNEELGRFRALDGKTWNHPVIAHGRLYVRNAEEMACYEVGAR